MTGKVSDSATLWRVCDAENGLCSKVDASESYAVPPLLTLLLYGRLISEFIFFLPAKPPRNNLGIFTPTWFTSATFLRKDDHRKIVAGTGSHQVRLYDISAQRRLAISFGFRETAIKAVCEDLDGYTVYVGNGTRDLASFHMRTGIWLKIGFQFD
ncbi:hypothetical protein CDL15_Pgr013974 [Punica granatum]|uniref:DUF2415 domain-containing protein n=1 Tax=Punica granatum TaxID=22663 RepID=A0A218WAF7_PUNGR|nr:hypothetical protein CDL15_Pgr013974 [Punica granatum]